MKKYAVLGYDTINIGDDIQSFIASTLVKPSYIVMRDNYEEVYDFETGERVELDEEIHLIMNGWFMHGADWIGPTKTMHNVKFPYKNDLIIPVFISTCLSPDCPELFEEESIEYLKSNSPVLCRDKTTMEMLEERGVDVEFSGCITATLDIDDVPDNPDYEKEFAGRTLFVHGDDLFRFQHVIPDKQPLIINQYIQELKGINPKERIDAAGDLLSQYKYVDKIYTTRLHCLLPARAMGLDVEFITADGKDCYRTKDLLEGSKEKEELKTKFYEVIGQ